MELYFPRPGNANEDQAEAVKMWLKKLIASRKVENQQTDNRVSDLELCDFYHRVIKRLLHFEDPVNISHFRRYLSMFDEYADDWCRYTNTESESQDEMTNLLVNSLHYRTLYLYRNNLVLSSAVALHFQNIFEENTGIQDLILGKKTIKMCALGAGATSDVVAIVKLLDCIADKTVMTLDIRVVIVYEDDEWKNTLLTVLNSLDQFRTNKYKVSFIQAVLSRPFSAETQQAIEGSDLVTIVKFASEFSHSPFALKRSIKLITDVISPGSILFTLDEANVNLFRHFGGYAGEMNGFHLLYDEPCYMHTIDLNTVEKLIGYYQKYFSALKCNSNLKISVRAWIKSSHQKPEIPLDLLQHRFGLRNIEMHNYQSFSDSSFENLKLEISGELTNMGWSEDGTEGYVFATVLERHLRINAFTEKIIECDQLQYQLAMGVLLNDGDLNSEGNWRKYVEAKSEVATMKQDIYRFSVLRLYNHISRVINGNWD